MDAAILLSLCAVHAIQGRACKSANCASCIPGDLQTKLLLPPHLWLQLLTESGASDVTSRELPTAAAGAKEWLDGVTLIFDGLEDVGLVI